MAEAIDNLNSVLHNIQKQKNAGSKTCIEPQLVVVSKFHDADKIRPLLEAGHRVFGESRLHEAIEKWPSLREEYKDVSLHYIGAIQSRKIKDIVKLFNVIQTIDKVSSAERIAKAISFQERSVKCMIQVNIGNEPQKSGVLPSDFDALYRACVDDYKLDITGIMCIPPKGCHPSIYFSEMQALRKEYFLPELSIGMSGDYLLAIEHGATMVRVGSAILGERK